MIVNLTAIDFAETAGKFQNVATEMLSVLARVTPKRPTQKPLPVYFYEWLEDLASQYPENC
jgi:hypothetical protein